MKLGFIDHYDSFSHNVIDWLTASPLGIELEVCPFDHRQKMAAIARQGLPLVLSPGPNSPLDPVASHDLLARALGKRPVLGICLGQQIIATHLGAAMQRSAHAFHGATKTIRFRHDSPLMPASPEPLAAASYNSLVVSPKEWPPALTVEATCEHGEVQALSVNDLPATACCWGVQFHPESFMSVGFEPLRDGFMARVKDYYDSLSPRPC